MRPLPGWLVRFRWWTLGIVLVVAVAAITLSKAQTPADTFEVWKLILDKGALGFLLVIAGKTLQVVLEKAKAAETWGIEVSRERIAIARRLMKGAQTLVASHISARIQEKSGQPMKDELKKALAAAEDLQLAVAEADAFFGEEVAWKFEAIYSISHDLLSEAIGSRDADEVVQEDKEELHELYRTAVKALQGRLRGVVNKPSETEKSQMPRERPARLTRKGEKGEERP